MVLLSRLAAVVVVLGGVDLGGDVDLVAAAQRPRRCWWSPAGTLPLARVCWWWGRQLAAASCDLRRQRWGGAGEGMRGC